MLRSPILHAIGIWVLILSISSSLQAEIFYTIVSKETFFRQEGPTPDDVIPDPEPYFFTAMIGVENQGDLSNPTVRRVGGAAQALVYDPEDGYELDLPFTSLAALEAAYPPGEYVMAYTPSGGAAVSTSLSLTGSHRLRCWRTGMTCSISWPTRK